MEFYKLSGAGNDFIILRNMDGKIPTGDYLHMAQVLCRRRLSVGADGLMIVERSATADFYMAFYNADGSTGEMCGNGARCICRYGYETGLAGEEQRVETASGFVTGRRLDRRSYRIRLTDPTVIKLSFPVAVKGAVYSCAYIELGTPGLPHAVVSMPGLAEMEEQELLALGRALRFHPAFPKGTNVNFYELTAPHEVFLRTYERGVENFTYACGTGSAATALAIVLQNDGLGQEMTCHNVGGDLIVEVLPGEGDVLAALYLSGPTNIVARGEITDEDLLPWYGGRDKKQE